MGNPKGRAWFRKQKFRRINGLVFRFLKRSEAKMTPEERIEMIEESIQFCIRTTGVDGGPTANLDHSSDPLVTAESPAS